MTASLSKLFSRNFFPRILTYFFMRFLVIFSCFGLNRDTSSSILALVRRPNVLRTLSMEGLFLI